MQTKTFNLNGLFDMRSCFWNENSLIELESSRFYCQFEFIVVDEVSFYSRKDEIESKGFPRLTFLFQKTLQFKLILNGIFYIKTSWYMTKPQIHCTCYCYSIENSSGSIFDFRWTTINWLDNQLNFQWLENKSYVLLFIWWHLQFKIWSKIEYMLEIDLKIKWRERMREICGRMIWIGKFENNGKHTLIHTQCLKG